MKTTEEIRALLLERSVLVPFSGCRIWEASERNGYGNLRLNNRTEYAHRLAYELFKGQIPEGLHVCHRCDVRACINPDHLFLGTNQDNIADSVAKGRRSGPRNRPSGLTYCRRNPNAYECARKLSAGQREEVRRLYAQGSETHHTLARRYGVSSTLIHNCIHGSH